MRTTYRNFIWLVAAALAAGLAVAFFVVKRSPVTLSVISVQRGSGSPTARCVIRNGGQSPIELTFHSIGHTPIYQRLEQVGTSWRDLFVECGIDAETRFLAPGETLAFTADLFTNQPIRLAMSYRLDGKNFTASSRTIFP